MQSELHGIMTDGERRGIPFLRRGLYHWAIQLWVPRLPFYQHQGGANSHVALDAVARSLKQCGLLLGLGGFPVYEANTGMRVEVEG